MAEKKLEYLQRTKPPKLQKTEEHKKPNFSSSLSPFPLSAQVRLQFTPNTQSSREKTANILYMEIQRAKVKLNTQPRPRKPH